MATISDLVSGYGVMLTPAPVQSFFDSVSCFLSPSQYGCSPSGLATPGIPPSALLTTAPANGQQAQQVVNDLVNQQMINQQQINEDVPQMSTVGDIYSGTSNMVSSVDPSTWILLGIVAFGLIEIFKR